MTQRTRRQGLRRRAMRNAICTAMICTTSCATWRPVASLDPASRSDTLGRVRVTLRDGTRVELRDAVVHADSLEGRDDRGAARIALDRAQIGAIETRAISSVRTVALVVGVAVVVTVYAIGKAAAELSSDIH